MSGDAICFQLPVQILGYTIHLTIKLQVSWGQAHFGTQTLAKGLQHSRCELGSPVWNNVLGHPIVVEHLVHQNLGVSIDVGRLFSGTSLQALEKWSTMIMIAVCPWQLGRSTVMWDQGHWGIGRGSRSPTSSWHEVCIWVQTVQA